MKIYRVGSRKSALAKVQALGVMAALEGFGLGCELVEIESEGDTDCSTPLDQMGASGPGIFTKRIQKALLKGMIDVAVHSLKDLPTLEPKGLTVGALSKRENSQDCLLIDENKTDEKGSFSLRKGALIGTSSLRRQAQILFQRPDCKVEPIRGNVSTRINKVHSTEVDAVILARAGLERLEIGLEGLRKVDLPEDLFVPAPGQGVLAIEKRQERDVKLDDVLQAFHDKISQVETEVEREILARMQGGCTLPLGVRCYAASGKGLLDLSVFLGREEGARGKTGQWKSFLHFGMSDADKGVLMDKAVTRLRNFLKET